MPEPAASLSVVIVARNEEDRVRGCIESVFRVCKRADAVGEFEVVLVDSNSTDRTVDVATEYPIDVLHIPSDDLSSCGAGRHVGFDHVTGDLVLFVDGDMDLEADWLDAAIGVLRRHDDVAGVDGWLSDRRGGCGEVDFLRGVAVYEAAAIDEIGGFDPRVKGLGDVDAGFRLGRAGYRLVRLPIVVASHPSSSGVGERFRRWREGYYLSNGQVLRKSLDDPGLLAKWLYRFRLQLAIVAWGVLGLVLLATRRSKYRRAWSATSVAGFAGLSAAKGVRWTVMKLSLRLLFFLLGMAIGFRRGPTPPEYPMERVVVVKCRDDHA